MRGPLWGPRAPVWRGAPVWGRAQRPMEPFGAPLDGEWWAVGGWAGWAVMGGWVGAWAAVTPARPNHRPWQSVTGPRPDINASTGTGDAYVYRDPGIYSPRTPALGPKRPGPRRRAPGWAPGPWATMPLPLHC